MTEAQIARFGALDDDEDGDDDDDDDDKDGLPIKSMALASDEETAVLASKSDSLEFHTSKGVGAALKAAVLSKNGRIRGNLELERVMNEEVNNLGLSISKISLRGSKEDVLLNLNTFADALVESTRKPEKLRDGLRAIEDLLITKETEKKPKKLVEDFEETKKEAVETRNAIITAQIRNDKIIEEQTPENVATESEISNLNRQLRFRQGIDTWLQSNEGAWVLVQSCFRWTCPDSDSNFKFLEKKI